jgi:phenylalanine-4-hydroxylase
MLYNITEGNSIKLEFEGNITVEGDIVTGSRNLQGEISCNV